ncbi:unnamed protein product [marine sediment metagenome]|uniref:Uncharacterized protein n=1 Tax=marine sediment metagenome TaxID=412755 RepID=X0WGR0_9ZZZZ
MSDMSKEQRDEMRHALAGVIILIEESWASARGSSQVSVITNIIHAQATTGVGLLRRMNCDEDAREHEEPK